MGACVGEERLLELPVGALQDRAHVVRRGRGVSTKNCRGAHLIRPSACPRVFNTPVLFNLRRVRRPQLAQLLHRRCAARRGRPRRPHVENLVLLVEIKEYCGVSVDGEHGQAGGFVAVHGRRSEWTSESERRATRATRRRGDDE